MEQILRVTRQRDAYFWATQGGAELDLLLLRQGRRIGFEFKYSEKPSVTRSMRVALDDLKLDMLTIVCPGSVQARLDPRIEVRGLQTIEEISRDLLCPSPSARTPARPHRHPILAETTVTLVCCLVLWF